MPTELKERSQWLCWRHATLDGRPTKEPVSAWYTGRRCNDKDPAKWASWDHAHGISQAHPHLAGIGYAFAESDPFTGLDYDDCRNPETGEVHPAVLAELVELSPCYAEVSPSRTGIKAIVRGKKPGSNCGTKTTPWGGGFEVYDKERYFTITGEVLEGFEEIGESSQKAIEAIYERRFPATEPMKHPTPIAPKRGILSDEQVIKKARASKNGAAFSRLFDHGDASAHGSRSEADFALMQKHLCFFCRKDTEQMARIFRRSALYRPEKEQRSVGYVERTAANAVRLYKGKVYDREGAAVSSREMVEAGMVAPLFERAWKGMAGATRHNVYCALLIEATENGTLSKTGPVVAPGYEKLMEMAGVGSKHTIINALTDLEKEGLILREAKHRPRARSRITLPRDCTTYLHAGGVGSISGAVLWELCDLLRLRWGQSQFAAASRVGKTAGLLLPWLFVYRDGCSSDGLAECLQRRADSVVGYLQRLEGRGLVIEQDGLWYLPSDFWKRFHAELEAEGITAAERIQHERHERHREAAREWSAREAADEREIEGLLNSMSEDLEDCGLDLSETPPEPSENPVPLAVLYGGAVLDSETGEVLDDPGAVGEPVSDVREDGPVERVLQALSLPESRISRALSVYWSSSEGAVADLDHVAAAVVLQLGESPSSWREWLGVVEEAVGRVSQAFPA